MSTVHQQRIGFGNGGSSLFEGLILRNAVVEANVDDVVNTGTYNQSYSWPIVPAQLLDLLIYCSAVVTLSTNGVNAVQTVTIGGGASGGTFTLTVGGQTTAPVAWNATAAQVQAALALLSSVPTTLLKGLPTPNIEVTGSAGGPWTLTYVGQLGLAPQATLTASGAGLTGGTPTITPASVTSGVAPDQTWVIAAGEPEAWATASGLFPSCPITGTVTSLNVTNTSGASAAVRIRAGKSQ